MYFFSNLLAVNIVKLILFLTEMDKNPDKKLAEKVEMLENELLKVKRDLSLSQKDNSEFKKIVDNANSFIMKISTEHTINYLNHFAEKLCKPEYEQIVGKSLLDVLIGGSIEGNTDKANLFMQYFSKIVDYQSFTSRHETRDKEHIWVHWTMKPGFDKHEKFVEYTIIGNDITDKKEYEELILEQKQTIEEKNAELAETIEELISSNEQIKESLQKFTKSELRFRIMSKSIPFGIFIRTPDGANNFVNDFYCKLTGLKYEEALGKAWLSVIHPDDADLVNKRWNSAAKKSPMKFNMRYKILNRRNKKISIVHTIAREMRHNEKLIGYVGVIEDITKEERLLNQLKKYQLIIRNSSEMMSLIDRQFRYIAVNDSYVRAHGLRKHQIEGKTFAELWGEDIFIEKIKENFDKAFQGKIVRYQDWFEFEHIGKKFMDVIYQPVHGRGGKVDFLTVNTLDITDLKETQSNLEKAIADAEKANKAKSEFLANMSHEIRTPLNAVIGFTELLESQITDYKQKKYLHSIKAGGRSLLTLINDILDLSKIEAGKMEIHFEPVHINNLIDEISQIFSMKIDEKDLIFETYADTQLPAYILLDETRLRQVLFNLVGNAIKFTKKGNIKLSFIQIGKTKDTIDLKITVEDTGIGIPKDQQTEIFRAFKQQAGQSTRKYGGTGLGLTISKKLIESMNGTIAVDSKVGVYTKFSVVLNKVGLADSSKKAIKLNLTEKYKLIFESANILVVDRIKENRDLISENFGDSEINIIQAANAQDAIAKLKTNKISLIIVDVSINELKNCMIKELTEFLSVSKIPVIAMSTSILNRENCKMAINFQGFLSKPMKRADLISLVSKFIKHKKIHKKAGQEESGELALELQKLRKQVNFNEIIKQIDNELNPLWEKAKRDELSDDIEHFSKKLKAMAEEYNIQILIKFADNLLDYLNSFDLEEMTKSLKRFPDIIKQIKNK